MGSPQKNFIVETNGSGVCLIDYDNDGWLDIYLVNGSTFDALDGKEEPTRMPRSSITTTTEHLPTSQRKPAFKTTAGVMAALLRDYDNDGWPDLFVGNYGKNRLYHNNHDGTFTDVAEKAGVALGNWSSGSDVGRLRRRRHARSVRLRLRAFRSQYSAASPVPRRSNYAPCQYRGVSVNCGPRGLPGEPDHLFHNNGDGTFTDVTAKAGVEDKDKLLRL